MSTMGGILSTVGDVQYCGGYHDARGDVMSTTEGVQYRGGKNLSVPHGTEHPHGTHDIPMVLKFQRMVSPRY